MKYFRIILLCFLFSGMNYDIFGCKCRIVPRDTSVFNRLKNHEIVFLGELIRADSTRYRFAFRILELFKGTYKTKIIKGKQFTSCSYFPEFPHDKGLWIVYTDFQEDSLIDINECGPSMSLINPDIIIPPPPLYSRNKEIEGLNWQIQFLNNKIDGLSNWNYELYKLRYYRQSTLIEKPKAKINYPLIIIGISLVLNVFMFIVIIKKKKMPAANTV